MAKLEDITVGNLVDGIVTHETVKVVAVEWHGSNVAEITFKRPNGSVGSQLLYRENENSVSVHENKLPWNFDIDGDEVKLVSEAYRIHLAQIFDPYLAVHTSAIEPLPHQISAVYETMLPRLPLRFCLADDPGAGKTIMTGLLIKEMMIRGELNRCLIVCPGSLAQQWQEELAEKFHLKFDIISNDRIENSASGNVFSEVHFGIARLDKLARNDDLQKKLEVTDWDLIVCDESHKMAATIWGGNIKYTKRFLLGRLLSNITQHFLMLTATPHNGKEEDFQLFMSLIDSDRFEGVGKTGTRTVDVSDVMRRLVKEELLKFDGKPLFPERRAYTVNYDLTDMESVLYQEVTQYVEEEFNRADKLENDRKTTVGFALTILQRRLASSPEAIYQSLARRLTRLQHRLDEERLGKRAAEHKTIFDVSDFDEDDVPSEELESAEESLVDQATAASTIQELQAEIETLTRLKDKANKVRVSGVDRKWDELSKLLQENELMRDSAGNREKLIIFTEHRDTLNYLTDKIRSLLGSERAVVTIHGGLLREERQKVQALFRQDKDVRVLIATDAAGEGVNLQNAHLMINYDLPWNPNKLEQRFGRIHRIGQTEVCHLWNLVSKETREGAVFTKLFEKLEQERKALGGKVFDVLGKLTFDNRPLRDLLIEAIRYGNQPEVKNKLNQVVDSSINKKALEDLIKENALTQEAMTAEAVFAIRDEMLRAEAHKLQPNFIEAFFLKAFQTLDGEIKQREPGRYEITHVPFVIRNRDRQIGQGQPVLNRYNRICFDKQFEQVGRQKADLICPGHPLMDAVVDLILERRANVLKRGGVFIDETACDTEPRILFYIEHALTDDKILESGARHVVSKQIHFVEIKQDGGSINAGYAPYLDYRSVTDKEKPVLSQWVQSQSWLTTDVEKLAMNYAISDLIPRQIEQIKSSKLVRIEKIEKAVKDRLTQAIQYWDSRAVELKEKEETGKVNAKLNAQQAADRANNLEARLQKRLSELEQEKHITSASPVIVSANLIIPAGLLQQLTGTPATFARETKAVETAAMNAVMMKEKSSGNIPRDVSKENCGYDIESKAPGGELRFIEVKGRAKGSTTVTVSKNEILTGLNDPDNFILALVEVDGEKTETTYLKTPFHQQPDFNATSVNFDLKRLIAGAVIV